MTTALIALALIGLLAYALNRNQRRNDRMAGGTGGGNRQDRDAQRLREELAYRQQEVSERQLVSSSARRTV